VRRSVLLLALALPSCAGGADGPATAPPSATSAASPTAAALDGCPQAFPLARGDPWVPAPPTTETEGRLVPDADPVDALLCRYRGVDDPREDGTTPLDGQVMLTGGLDRIRTDLLVPGTVPGGDRVCTEIGAPQLPHLLRLRYADGELWLSATQEVNGCTSTGNGAFVSPAYLGERFAEAYDARTWRSPVPEPGACRGGTGRAGQEQALVPAGWRQLVVCEENDAGREVEPGRAALVAALLGEVATRPDVGACEGVPDRTFGLVFRYEVGPDVRTTWLPGCEPALSNGSLSATLTPVQADVLTDLLTS
jgi:hypothetical protein